MSAPSSPNKPTHDYLFKVLLIGDSGVGKSSILNRFVTGSYDKPPQPTTNTDYQVHSINVEGKVVKLQVWDTAGQERFRTLTTSYFRGAHGILIVYDITNEDSFNNVAKWLQEIQNYTYDNLTILLAGNKVDLADKQLVASSTGKDFATQQHMQFIETSAKTGHNIDQSFAALATDMKRKHDAESMPAASSTVKVGGATGKKKPGCVIL
eukprot:Phypoly_transcript_16206.p1 GENE.Phypoly_transcript_16206~~Phypoly_transcript_16206.p1  ORF type:complete len:209 (+),score=30.27 Phypoly_transcript_16206:171-797(+)